MEKIGYKKEIPVIKTADVCVVGGGPSGFIAAIAAAREGAKTLIVERTGVFGGLAATGYVSPISGFYHNGERAVGGIAYEFIKKLEESGAAKTEFPKGHISFDPEEYKRLAAKMLALSGVEVLTNTFACDVVCENKTVKSAVVCAKNGISVINAGAFVDATGDGDLCFFAGMPMLEKTGDIQPLSLCFVLENVDVSTPLLCDSIHHDGKDGKPSVNTVIRDYLLNEAGIKDFCGPWFNYIPESSSLTVNVTRISADATDPAELTKAETKLREDMFRIVGLLKKKYPEFKNAHVVSSASNAGVRESRHIKGKYTLTGDDLKTGKTFACPIARCAHPMDIHASKGAGQELIRFEKKAFVPFECTVSEGFPNLISAGRSFSADREAYASARVQGTVMSIGEAVGKAAAISVKTGVPIDLIGEKYPERLIPEIIKR